MKMNLPNRSSWTQCDHNSTYFAVPTAQVGRAHRGTGVNVVGTYPTYLCYVTNRKLEWVYSFWRQCCAEILQDNKQKHSDWIKGWIQILKWKFLSGSVLIAVLYPLCYYSYYDGEFVWLVRMTPRCIEFVLPWKTFVAFVPSPRNVFDAIQFFCLVHFHFGLAPCALSLNTNHTCWINRLITLLTSLKCIFFPAASR